MPIFPGLDSSGSKRKTPSSGTDAISMNNILRNMAKGKQYKSVVKHRYNMADVMRVIVSQMEYFTDPPPPVYWWLLDHSAEDPMKMQIFVGLRNDAQRISFIQRVHTKAMISATDDCMALSNASMVSIQMLVMLMEAAANYLKIKNT
ncbi:hypothetical protein RHSIM_Rhsim05G0061200 [Rhododendron simsii]|uniref:Uncharacterized protein n=1 Tax=Rhododendron simsii TaxID=118357 RepID=A0A834H1E3_RHOSS|nr:hypothetical protein RHSIM_Rhsim05G0061200 [Rhododendron simsii]